MGVSKKGSLKAVASQVRRMGTTIDIAKAVGSEILALVDMGFENETDPYGAKWKKFRTFRVKRKKQWVEVPTRTGKLLQLSGVGRNSFKMAVLPLASPTIRVFASVRYMNVHQTGKVINARPGGLLHFSVGGARGRSFRTAAKSVTIPRRMMVPQAGSCPPIWRRAIAEATQEAIQAKLGKASNAR